MKVKSKRKMAGILAAVLIALVLLAFDCINGDPISERWAMHRAIQFAEKLYPDQTFTAENAGSMRGFCYTVGVQSQQSRDTRFYVETSFWLFTSDTHTVDHTQYVDARLNTAWRMNEWHAIKYMFSHRFKGAMAKFIVTMICTIVFDLTVAIVVGVGLGLILMVARLSKLQINYERVDMSRIKNNDEALSERYRNAMVAYITGPLIFANIDTIEQLTERVGTCDTLLLSMRGVPYIDISAAQALMNILRSLHENGVDIVLCGLPSSAMNMMHRSGIYDMVGEQGFYWSVERALLDLRPYTGKK